HGSPIIPRGSRAWQLWSKYAFLRDGCRNMEKSIDRTKSLPTDTDTDYFFFDAFRKEPFNQVGRLIERINPSAKSMGQNTAIVPEDIDALSMRSSSSMAALRSQSRRI